MGGKAGRPQGGTKFANAKLQLNKKTKVNPDAKITKIEMEQDDGSGYRCSCCGKRFRAQRGNFAVSNSPLYVGNNGYIDICKTCLDKYYSKLVEFYSGNEEKAIERCCQLFDWYYSDDAVAMTAKSMSSGKTRMSLYPSKVGLIQIRSRGTTFLDTIAERANETIEDIDDVYNEEINPSNDEQQVSEEEVMFFGAGYKPSEYRYLRNQYDEWVSRYETKTKAQEELMKNLCIVQLSIQQAKQRGSTKDANDAMKTFQDLLGSANLKPNQNNDNSLVEQNTFGTLIKRWEDEAPIPEPEEEFKDVDNIEKYISTFFFGHLAKMMKIDNDYSKMYDEEMSQYTVTRQEYQDDIEEEDTDGERE